MSRALRAFFTRRPVLRALLLAALPLLAFGLSLEWRLREFLETTTTARGPVWTEFRPHPTLFWRLRPGLDVELKVRDQVFHLKTSSLGLRGEEVPVRKPPQGWRAWCLGDSITYGYGVSGPSTYQAQLQQLLQAARPDREIQVLNGGCPGWSSYQARLLTEQVGLAFKPDLYILGFTYADPAFEDVSDARRVDRNPLVRWFKLGLDRSELYMYLRQRVVQRTNPTGAPPEGYSLKEARISEADYRGNLMWFVEQARLGGGHVLILNLAKRDPDPHGSYARYRALAREVAESTGSGYLDVDALFRGQPDPRALFSDRIHPNAAGFRLMAQAMAGVIEERGWIR